MKIALVHDFLFEYAGSERVLEQILKVFPGVDLFAVIDFLRPDQRFFLQGRKAKTTFIQSIPLLRRAPARLLPLAVPLMPLAIEQLDLSGYDLVLSSSHSVAKGVITSPDQLHIAYVHSPMRYAWDLQPAYLAGRTLGKGPAGWLARVMLSYLRIWDARTANGVDSFIANSQFVARRIWKTYRREASVIYPPVDVTSFPFTPQKEDYYLAVSRLVPYKRIDLVVEAFRHLPNKQLVVIGDGPERNRLQRIASPNVKLLGYQPADKLIDLMKHAKAFIIAAVEDFGIAPVEAQACGTPVIAFKRGGVNETVRPLDQADPTGIFFEEQSVPSLVQAIRDFEIHQREINPISCRENALRFQPERFQEEYKRFILDQWQVHTGNGATPGSILLEREAWVDR